MSATPEDARLLDRIASARARLCDRLAKLDLKSSGISEYNQRYLAGKLPGAASVLELYGRLLFLSMKDSPVPPGEFVLVDYGGGSGLISFLAVEMGIGTVVYNDIYDVSCADVGKLSDALGLRPHHIVCGDADELVSYLQKNSISVNAVASYDVIEHVYDVGLHFRTLRRLSGGGLRIVHASGANAANPLYARSARKKHLEAERENREKEWGHKERDTLRAYLDVRREMISSYAPDLASEQVGRLALATRGLIRRDIERCVDEFRREGRIAYRPDHPTNTCDPVTGNWCEHLMDFGWIEKILRDEGFSVEILPGLYSTGGSPPKRLAKAVLNSALRVLGRRGMFMAPYYVVCAECGGKGR